jgi:ribosome production factor 1
MAGRSSNNTASIACKVKRTQVYAKVKRKKKLEKQARREKRKREAEELGLEAPPKQIPKTLDNTREADSTVVRPDDEEVVDDEATDEFADYFSKGKVPKLMITTRPKPSPELYKFIGELLTLFPNAFYYKRGNHNIKDICRYADNKKFTHLVVLSEKNKICNGAIVSHLNGVGEDAGPTAFFKVSNVVPARKIKGHGNPSQHLPEILLNNFNTRLGHRVGRMLGSMFPHNPEFRGRQVVTFHNQRDFIFVRHHRYIFETGKKARLQELGPRFTLKLRWLQQGTFDSLHGEYEWVHKRKQMDTSRRRFHL